MKDPWLPKDFAINSNVFTKILTFAGDRWQIYKLSDGQNLFVVLEDLVSMWDNTKLLDKSIWKTINISDALYYYLISKDNYMIVPIDFMYFTVNKTSALSFAYALYESRKILPDVSFEGAIFLEQYTRLLPNSTLPSDIDDAMLLGTWISGGANVSTNSMRRLKSLNPFFTTEEYEQIISTAGLKICSKSVQETGQVVTKKERDIKFTLSGAEYLETFFYENVIDIALYPEKYEPLGISFPSPIILYGLPGSGKTYAVEKLAEYLDWPIYIIDSNSIASTYIHDTPKKIASIFTKAFEMAPSIIIIDEMESYLSKRDHSHDHKVEEVGEFLRLIPEASKNNVLVIGMTNLFENLDPAVLRTGRFDHKIEVHLPNKEDVKAMIDTALTTLPVENDIILDRIIEYLVDKPRSDTTFIIKEAARLTAFRGKSKISQEEFDVALKTKRKNTKESDRKKIGF